MTINPPRSVFAALLIAAVSNAAVAGQFEDATAAYNRGDYATAIRLWHPLADKGDAKAQITLAHMFATGHGVERSEADAMKWYRKAAEQGDVWAQFCLGEIYATGQAAPSASFVRRLPVNKPEAAKWYRLAAEQGYNIAQFSIGAMYVKGEDVPQNYVIAHMWFNLAASKGDSDATKDRNTVAGKMTPQQIAEAQKLAAEWKPKTWDQLRGQVSK